MYKFFVSFRYLTARKVNFLAMLAVTVSVMAFIIVASVMSGILLDIRARIRASLSDITVVSDMEVHDYQEIARTLRGNPHIRGVTPYVDGVAMVRFEVPNPDGWGSYVHTTMCNYRGVTLEWERETTQLNGFVQPFRLDGKEVFPALEYDPADFEDPEDDKYPPILIGTEFYVSSDERGNQVNGMYVGQLVKLFTVYFDRDQGMDQTTRSNVRSQVFRVAGFFKSGWYDLDHGTFLINVHAAQRLRKPIDEEGNIDDSVNRFSVKLDDYANAGAVKQWIAEQFPFVTPKTWEEMRAVALRAEKLEGDIMRFLMFFLILLSGFLTLAILVLIVYQKYKEIGMLKAMGATAGGITSIFVLNGAFVGAVGLVFGLLFGYVVLVNVNPISDFVFAWTGFRLFPTDLYYIEKIPVDMSPQLFWFVAWSTLAVSLLASLYPAWRAGRMNPVEALRYE